ncbi:putative rho GTPase-activating protein 8 [Scophthalmus maximus]|uniref:Putative rho GTPase-activating protein 8 n=1 Tax=Scophthalmus maximus TaxID=52904 RepID=A0A2U9BR37_SCOMX|nr:putative rho GTPase-activating protein 8 [Scophthalmus maximus]
MAAPESEKVLCFHCLMDFIHPPSQQEPEPRGFFTSTVSFFVFLRDSRVTVLDKYEESALMSTTVCSASNMVIKHNQILTSDQQVSGVHNFTPTTSTFFYISPHVGFTRSDDLYGRKQIVFSSCCLPPSHQLNHRRLLEFLKFTLDQYVEMDYILVYFHHGLRSSNKPSLEWLREAYDEFDRKYKKNLKTLYVVHPTNFIRIVWNIFKPLISHKFGKKLKYVNFLDELRDHVNYEQLVVPADVLRHDEKLRAAQRGGASPLVKTPPPRPPLPSQQFGVSLQYIREKRREATIPLVLQQTVDYLKVKGLRTEGIFRRSARVQIIKDVQKLYNLGKPVNFDEFSDVHVPAVILKTFLRDLPEPLLTFRVYGQVQDVLNVESSLRVSRCRHIVESLPELNFIVLKFLMCFLHMVSQQSIINKMSPSNLACVFGVNLVRPRHGSISLSDLTPINVFTELLVEHFAAVFGSRCPPGQVTP